MDLSDHEPRKHPVPVPFCEVIAKPTVPELSLISLEESSGSTGMKNEAFSGTQFQTYNAWKWKYMNEIEKLNGGSEKQTFDKCRSPDNCFLIKDKYSSSETEKRKNEILYGHMEEPRQPMMAKPVPEIPKMNFSTSNSFDDPTIINDSTKSIFQNSLPKSKNKTGSKSETNEFLKEYRGKDLETSNKLYNIITDQNNQIEILQKQMEQILRLQDVKDKQINQLLKLQESKEKKIEKLLESIDVKDEEIEKLLKLKFKQDSHINDLRQAHEDLKIQNLDLSKRLKSVERKETHSVSTMTDKLSLIDSSTNTSLVTKSDSLSNEIKNNDDSCLRNTIQTNEFPERDRSLSLHSVDLPVIKEHAPTPQGSIHLDIQDFHYSSEDSDSETGTVQNNIQPPQQMNSNPLGYTFYNNVITQVKDIIQNSGEKEVRCSAKIEGDCMRGKKSSVQSFQSWEVVEKERVPSSAFISPGHFPNRFLHDPSNLCMKESYSPSDISLKMNTLAMKYLKQEQISQYNLERQISAGPRHPDVTIYNVTNLSFGSTRMDRYNVLPSVKEVPHQSNAILSPGLFSRRRRKVLNESVTSCDQIGNGLSINQFREELNLT